MVIKLKLGAIPTICTHKTYDQINIDGTTVTKSSRNVSLMLERSHVSFFRVFFTVKNVEVFPHTIISF